MNSSNHYLEVSTINTHFTFSYAQPNEYRFSHDSVFLARKIFEIVRDKGLNYDRILDLCSGCGIVGLDLAFHLNDENLQLPKRIDFLEVQSIYRAFFEKNVETLNSLIRKDLATCFINANYDSLIQADSNLSEKYDLIISNPPYFRKDQGVLSKSEFKNRCRFFIDSDFKNLIEAIQQSLNKKGHAFILLKSLAEHGVDIEKEFTHLNTRLMLRNLGLIRDTGFYEITHQS